MGKTELTARPADIAARPVSKTREISSQLIFTVFWPSTRDHFRGEVELAKSVEKGARRGGPRRIY